MKISYLILAHDNYHHLERLVHALDDGNCRIYIHIDKKSPMPTNICNENTIFLKERISVWWLGFSTIEATIKLLEHAEREAFGEYFVFISGTDYPIRSNQFFYDRLAEGGEFINILKGFQPGKAASRYIYHHFDGVDRRKRNLQFFFFRCIEKLLAFAGWKKTPPFQIFVGSQWFALSKGCAGYVLKTAAQDLRYRHFFKNTLCPDEAFFQSIIGNSPYGNQTKNNLTFTDFGSNASPCLISDRHVDSFCQTQVFDGMYGKYEPFFARKFSDESTNVVALIEEKLRANNSPH